MAQSEVLFAHKCTHPTGRCRFTSTLFVFTSKHYTRTLFSGSYLILQPLFKPPLCRGLNNGGE